jgi:hypothetical protein
VDQGSFYKSLINQATTKIWERGGFYTKLWGGLWYHAIIRSTQGIKEEMLAALTIGYYEAIEYYL